MQRNLLRWNCAEEKGDRSGKRLKNALFLLIVAIFFPIFKLIAIKAAVAFAAMTCFQKSAFTVSSGFSRHSGTTRQSGDLPNALWFFIVKTVIQTVTETKLLEDKMSSFSMPLLFIKYLRTLRMTVRQRRKTWFIYCVRLLASALTVKFYRKHPKEPSRKNPS